MKISRKLLSFFVILTLLFTFVTSNTFAYDSFDVDTPGSIHIDYNYEGRPLKNVKFNVYQVAETVALNNYKNTSTFSDFHIDYDNIECTDYWKVLNSNLQNHINLNDITPDYTFISSDFMSHSAENLDLGLYIILAEDFIWEDYQFISDPTLIMVGSYDTNEKQWIYNHNIKPKISLLEHEKNPNISVRKVWKNVSDLDLTPDEVEVKLYCDTKLYDTVILNEENGWQHTWDNLENSCCSKWAVIETEIEDYEVQYENNNYNFIITNTYVGDPPDELPQTGSNAHQISIFAGIGLILILLGFIVNYKGKFHEN